MLTGQRYTYWSRPIRLRHDAMLSAGLCQSKILARGDAVVEPLQMTKPSPFRYFKTSPEIIRLAVMIYVRFPLSLRNIADQHERGIDICQETVRFWWNRFSQKPPKSGVSVLPSSGLI